MKKLFLSVVMLLALLLLPSLGIIAQDQSIADTVIEASEADEAEFTILLELLEASDLVDTLADEDAEFTVFAPSDEAFESLLEESDLSLNDLLDDTEALSEILLYHLVEGVILQEDMEDGDEFETLNGASISVSIGRRDTLILNETSVLGDEILASNGVIHVIDTVLAPPRRAATASQASGGGTSSSSSSSSDEICTVSTDTANFTRVRVGPGENRTSVTFLPINQDFVVLGQTEDSEGNIWYQLDKDEAAAGRAINEAWVAASEVETAGNCDDVADAAAPPVIPIINQPQAQPTANPDGGSGGDSTQPTVAPAVGIRPNTGRWTISLSETTNASCRGSGNIVIPTTDIFFTRTIRTSLSDVSDAGFIFDGVQMTNIGNGVYQGALTIGGLTGTFYIDSVVTANQMVGRFIASFNNCSTTTTFVANRG